MKRFTALLLSFAFTSLVAAEDIRIGLIGLDTSHVTAFTKIINDPKATGPLAKAKVTAAFRGGSLDVPSSANRLDKFTDTLTKQYGVKLYPTIAELCKNVDAIMLESVDGRPKVRQAIPVIDAGLPLFIDKPMAGSLADAISFLSTPRKRVCRFSARPRCATARPPKPPAPGRSAKSPTPRSSARARSRCIIRTCFGTACTAANRSSP